MRGVLTGVALILLLPVVTGAQSLADVARLEAARRQAINRLVPLVTNADLDVRPAPVPPSLPPFPTIPSIERAPGPLVAPPSTSFWNTPWPESERALPLVIVHSGYPLALLRPGHGRQGLGEARAARRLPAPGDRAADGAPPTGGRTQAAQPFSNPLVDALFDRVTTPTGRRRPQ